MTAFLAIVRVTLRQLLGGKRLIILGLLGAIPAVVVWFATANQSSSNLLETYNESAIPTLFFDRGADHLDRAGVGQPRG